MLKIKLQDIKSKELQREPGYYDYVVSKGKIVNGILEIAPSAYYELLKKYRPTATLSKPCCNNKSRKIIEQPISQSIIRTKRGLGDIVKKTLSPFVNLIDKTLGTDLKNCGRCAKNQALLNRIKI